MAARAVVAASTSTKNSASLIALANGFRDAGATEKAAELYGSVLQLLPERNDIRLQYGNMSKDSGELCEAEAAYRQIIMSDPQDAEAHLQLGHAYKLMGRRGQALDSYRSAVAADPTLFAAANELAAAGERAQQDRLFDAQLRAGALDPLLAMSHQLEGMRDAIDRTIAALPDPMSQLAFPIASYRDFRNLFTIPAPPVASRQTFTLLLLADREPLDRLYAQVAAIRDQSLQDWRLIGLGRDAARASIFAAAAIVDPRVAWIEAQDTWTELEAELRGAVTVSTGWLVFFQEGATLHPHALAWFAASAELGPATAFIADHDLATTIDDHVVHSDPVLRQVVDYDTLLDANVFGETLAIKAATFRSMLSPLHGGSSDLGSGDASPQSTSWGRSSWLLELAMAGQVGHVPFGLTSSTEPLPDRSADHRAAVAAHLARHGLEARLDLTGPDGDMVTWRPVRPEAGLTVIIPTRDNAADVATMVDSLVAKAANPDALRLLILDNGTTRSTDLALLEKLAASGRIERRVIDEPFNWSRLNNQAAASVDTPHLVFANDDMRMLTSGWDRRIRGLLERDDVGAVGVKLLYDDDTLQHAGVLFGWKGSAIHDGVYEPADSPGPLRRWQVTRSASAVTGAFLATRRDVFLAHQGFDDVTLPVGYSDLDYALKLRSSGLKVIWTPAISLYHHESKSRGLDHLQVDKAARNQAERALMRRRWGGALDHDPSVHPLWYPATLPFHLISMPSADRIRRHIRATSKVCPWEVTLMVRG
ncbi:glycosyltransferase [Lichenihabitans sp. PAMC28606]|uniref:glycosyltransferase n=1 Tax=Lichenihabitans sp. PAMC28606 TaxID=2880932 RepID=UPI001D0B4E60|nr:glycosyltransferase [Lichenihabitans sp. PAMC28606]UDL94265.1 glycosyltransferase [Lichenihabitans sp. PAMC28606]